VATTAGPTAITTDGVVPVSNVAASGDKISGAGTGVFVNVANGGGSPITLTITPSGNTAYGVANPAKVFTIANATQKDIPIPAIYANPSDSNLVTLVWSATTSVTWSVKRI
jgi:hypothetical protein